QQIAQLEAQPHQGLQGFIRGIKDHHDAASLQAKLTSAKAELDNRYRSVVEQLHPPTGIADADSVLTQINAEMATAAELDAQRKDLLDRKTRVPEKINRRGAAISDLGFDAPAVEADLISNGLRPITTNLVLKRGEIAVVSVPATLCRYRTRTQYVGSSQGLSIPLGHGLRYRVS